MKKFLIIFTIMLLFFTIGCKTENKNSIKQESDLSDVIVVYFSVTGNTKTTAKYIADYLECGIFEIKPTEPYTKDDIQYYDVYLLSVAK